MNQLATLSSGRNLGLGPLKGLVLTDMIVVTCHVEDPTYRLIHLEPTDCR